MASSTSKVPVAQADTFPDGTTDHVPLRKKTYDLRKPRTYQPVAYVCVGFEILTIPDIDITDQPITWANWYQHVNWLNTYFIIMVPMVGLISSYWVSLQLKTAIFAVAYYFFAGLGISEFDQLSESIGIIRTNQHTFQLPATTVCGLTQATRRPFLSRSSSPLVALPLLKVALVGGPASTAPTIATPIPRRTRTPSARASSTATSDGWS